MNNYDILKAREERVLNLKRIMEEFGDNYSFVTIKSNYPREEKTNNITIFLVHYFENRINKIEGFLKSFYYESLDGPYYISIFNLDSLKLKEKMINIEENDKIGRFIDLDVFYKDLVSISRSTINKEKRKCIICEEDVNICMRLNKHKKEEVIDKIKEVVNNYLTESINSIITESMLIELDLDPKFGLVTKNSNGSHKDMDYNLMKKSIDVVSYGIANLFNVGFNNNLIDTYSIIRKKGQEIEEEMLKVTNGINTYKGLIFVLGFLVSALGNYLTDFSGSLFNRLKGLAKGINNDFINMKGDTFGEDAYLKYGIKGARGIVIDGMPLAFELSNDIEFDKASLICALAKIIASIDDTVFLKRAKTIEKYNYYKERFNKFTYNELDELTNLSIKDNLSFGGSADILIATIFLKKLKEFIDYE